jgi:hypothetical protein
MDGVNWGNAKDIGMCSMAVVSIQRDGLTPGIDQRTPPMYVDPGYVVPHVNTKWWWISSEVGGRVVKRQHKKKETPMYINCW